MYETRAEMQIDAQRIEAMPLTITVTMSVAAWRKCQEAVRHTKAYHTASSNLEWAIRDSLAHIDAATSKKVSFGNLKADEAQ